MVPRYLRFRDLKERGIVSNRVTLGSWIQNQGFPPGRLIGPNARAWTEAEISDYLKRRPTAPKITPRPRKAEQVSIATT